MSTKREVIIRRKGKNVSIPRWVHEFNQRKKAERRLAKQKQGSSCQK